MISYHRAELIVDQWRKKSMLYKSRSVLIPLGDDFRYTQSTEWEAQRVNYDKLFDYINNEPSLNVEVNHIQTNRIYGYKLKFSIKSIGKICNITRLF